MSSPDFNLDQKYTTYTDTGEGAKQLVYKPNVTVQSANHSWTAFFSSVSSSLTALFSSFFGETPKAKELRSTFKVIEGDKSGTVEVAKQALNLGKELRSHIPVDIGQSEIQNMRDQIVRALFNNGDFKEIVKSYADWPKEGSEREGEVWRLAYDELLGNIAVDPEAGAIVLSHVDQRYTGLSNQDLEEKKFSIGTILLNSNRKAAEEALKVAIAGASGEKKTKLESAHARFEIAQLAKMDTPEYLVQAWAMLNNSLVGTPAFTIISRGYNEFKA